MEPTVADNWASKVEELGGEVDEILQEEKDEKQLAQAEMQVTKGENLIKHEAEIMSRPKRTWFETEKQKRETQKVGAAQLNGPDAQPKKEKKKLSNKDKKRLDLSRERSEGKIGFKKGKTDRENQKMGKMEKPDKKKKGQKKGKK